MRLAAGVKLRPVRHTYYWCMGNVTIAKKIERKRPKTFDLEEKRRPEEGVQRKQAKRKWANALGQREQADRQLREALAAFGLSHRNPAIPARQRILQKDLLDSLVIYRPTSRQEFAARIPTLLLDRIHPEELKHLDAILVLCRGAKKTV